MVKFNIGNIAKVAGKDIVGRVIETFDKTTKLMTCEGEKTFPNTMLELIGAFDRKKLVVHPEQQLLKEYRAEKEGKYPKEAKCFCALADAMIALVGWHPGDETWHFHKKTEGGSNLAIRVPTGKTSNLLHLSCHQDGVRVELEGKKKCPADLAQYFPKKGSYFGGNRKDITGEELTEKYTKEFIEVLKAVYRYNTRA